MDIYPSYTYHISWTNQNKHYYGVRLANKCMPEDDFWIRYKSSSKYVKAFIEKYGEPDIIKVDKVFDDNEEAILYELDFLIENKCIESDEWLNLGLFAATTHSEETRQKISEMTKGHKKSAETRSRISKARKGKYTGKDSWNYGTTHTEQTKQKMRTAMKRRVESGEFDNPEWRDKIRTTNLAQSDEISARVKNDWNDPVHAEWRKSRMKGATRKIQECPHCGKQMRANLSRHIKAQHS